MGRYSPTVLPIYPVSQRGSGLDRFAEALSSAAVGGQGAYYRAQDRKRAEEDRQREIKRQGEQDEWNEALRADEGYRRIPGGATDSETVQMPGRPVGPGGAPLRASESITPADMAGAPDAIHLSGDIYRDPYSPRQRAEDAGVQRKTDRFTAAVGGRLTPEETSLYEFAPEAVTSTALSRGEQARQAPGQKQYYEALRGHPRLGAHYGTIPYDPEMDYRNVFYEASGRLLEGDISHENAQAGAIAGQGYREPVGPAGLTKKDSLAQAEEILKYDIYNGTATPADVQNLGNALYEGREPGRTGPQQFGVTGPRAGGGAVPEGVGVSGTVSGGNEFEEALQPRGAATSAPTAVMGPDIEELLALDATPDEMRAAGATEDQIMAVEQRRRRR